MDSISRFWRVCTACALFFGLFVGSTANAGMYFYYGELLSSSEMTSAPNTRFEILARMTHTGSVNNVLTNSQTQGAGLGDAWINSGDSLTYEHTFSPTRFSPTIISAAVNVLTYSRQEDSNSYIELRLNNDFWLQQNASFRITGGQIDTNLVESDGNFTLSVSANGDDVKMVSSLFEVTFEPGSSGGGVSAAIPEPGAAMLFATGIVIVATSIRRKGQPA